jgi:uncharacterized membrane protein YhaH (DUF805 family)
MKTLLFSFAGRVGRKTFWMAMLGIIALMFALQAVIVGLAFVSETAALIGSVVALPVAVAALVGGFAVQAKRWHDVDKSGWWLLIAFVPVIGLYALIMNGFVKGTDGANQFGADPVAGNGSALAGMA